MRIALGIEYNGSNYYGWQRQAHANSIQQTIEEAISKVANTTLQVHAAGRTDTAVVALAKLGVRPIVHAVEQIAHFDCAESREMKAWVMGTNSHLPNSITILWAKPVDDDYHARFSAVSRRYRYVILNRPTRPAILFGQVTWVYKVLDVEKMSTAADSLIGTHDFSSYRALSCQAKSPIRTVHDLQVTRKGEFIFIDIHADAFLHHMVRNIAGVLIEIGAGEQNMEWSKTVLELRDRTQGGVTASASGLYLVKVQYDEKYGFDPKIRQPEF